VAEAIDGKPYNVNADLVAGRVASALRARRLVYMSDVPGLLANAADPASLISTLKISQVDELKKKGVIDKGMRPKVASAIRALQEGVQRVHFIDGRLPHSLLLENLHRPRHRHGDCQLAARRPSSPCRVSP